MSTASIFGATLYCLKEAKIFDGRNLFGLDEMRERGFYYESIGRETIVG